MIGVKAVQKMTLEKLETVIREENGLNQSLYYL